MPQRILFTTRLVAGSLGFVLLGAGTVAQAQQPAPAAPVAAAAPAAPAAPAAARAEVPKLAATARPAVSAPVQAQVQPYVPATDPYGFTNWLNSVRASYGLPPVGYDPNLTNWAAMNNSQQAARGMGHFVMGPARRQNSAMGHYTSIGSMWLNSPGHRAALLDPSIRWIGIAGWGAYWTFNAY